MTIDTEEEWDWKGPWPVDGYTVENIQRLPAFQSLCARHGVATTYFVDKAVVDDDAARETVMALSREPGVEIGMHIHPWNTPPLDTRGAVRARDTFLHNLPEPSINAKLDCVLGALRGCGFRPVSFRGGRYSSGGAIHRFLRDQDFLVDASVVPFTTWEDEGAPTYVDRGLDPVRLPPDRAGQKPLWEIPLTLAFTRKPFAFWKHLYEFIERSFMGKLHLIGILERLAVVRKVWLNFEEPLGKHMLSLLETLRPLGLPCICFTVHSSSLMAGKSPYTRTREDERRLFDQVDEVFATLAGWHDFRSATLADVAAQLEQDFHARSRD